MAEDKCPANAYVFKVMVYNFDMSRKLYLMVICFLLQVTWPPGGGQVSRQSIFVPVSE